MGEVTVPRRRAALRAWIVLAGALAALLVAGCNRAPAPSAKLEIVRVEATSRTSIAVRFNMPVAASAEDPSRYEAVAPDGTALKILDAFRDADHQGVTLATEPQLLVPYRLSVRNLRVAGAGPITLAAATPFPGSARDAPVVASAVALGHRQVLVSFAAADGSAPAAMAAGATDPTSYRIQGPDLDVIAAVYAGDGSDRTRVILTTSAQLDAAYAVTVRHVVGAAHGELVDPYADSAAFDGVADPDAAAPRVRGAVALDPTTVLVRFNEPLANAAAQAAHFAITDADGRDVPVTRAVLNDVRTDVTLTTWELLDGVSYDLVVSGVADRSGNPIGANATAFTGTPRSAVPDATPPRVVGAASTSNTTVIVTFSEPLAGGSYSAEDPSHYSIVDAPASGAVRAQALLNVTKAVLSANGRTVTLTTMAQSEIDYQLRVTDVKDLAGNQIVPPDRDHPYQAVFAGTGTSGAPLDTDGDGLSDAAEQLGWKVTVELADGSTTTRSVTSDPGDPSRPQNDPVNVAARDTDQDGIPDKDERTYRTDPRSADTDGDALTDERELNAIYSDPTLQDSDGDGLTDGLEVDFFHTSPIFADTDGDGLTDDYELATANRNPRIADLPLPQIKIGSVDLALDVRFETESQQGTNAVDTKASEVTLAQDQSRTVSTSDSTTNEWFWKAGAEVGFEAELGLASLFGIGDGSKISAKFSTEGGVSGSSTFQVSNETAESSSKSYANTLSTEKSYSRQETLSRHVDAASIAVLVDVQNLGNIAFTMSDLEVTALVKDPRDPRILTPVATLLPANPDLTINLGPLDSTSRGPFRFVANDAFPSRVEDLMANPRGIVFKVANFTITDEEGRSFSFGEQTANDRTAPLVIDYGAKADSVGRVGAVERYRVATASEFDANGHPEGITVAQALEDVLGLTYYREEDTPSSSLTADELTTSYSTFDMPSGLPVIYRIRNARPAVTIAQLKAGALSREGWAVLLDSGIDLSVNVRDFVLQPQHGLTLAYFQDLDGDNVPARVELYYGSYDDPAAAPAGVSADDSDGDHVTDPNDPTRTSDNFEVYGGWSVRVNRAAGDAIQEDVFQVRSSPARADTDADGLSDWEEQHGCRDANVDYACDANGGYGISVSGTGVVTHFLAPTDPTSADTDGDRVLDSVEVNGFNVTPTLGPAAFVRTDPTDVDTDNDGVADGDERLFGGNPALADVASFTDTDGDGLLDQQEIDGWDVTYRQAATTFGAPGTAVTVHVTSDPAFGRLDTDGDGLSDGEEYALHTDPRSADTDGDGISDYDEVKGTFALPFDGNPRVTNPLDADTDHDRLSDGGELVTGWGVTLAGVTTTVRSDPTNPDLDGDGLYDYDEKNATVTSGTDPNDPDTDGDTTTDKVEVDRNRDADPNNNTSPVAKDQLLTLAYEGRGVKWTNGLICGVTSSPTTGHFIGTLSFTLNASTTSYGLDAYWQDVFVPIQSWTRVYQGGIINAKGENMQRVEGTDGVRYNLSGFNENVVATTGAFQPIGAVVQKTFHLQQQPENNDVCAMEARFTVTPVMDH